MENTVEEFENRVVIIGVGLIGGSIAAAVRKRFPGCQVIGIGRCRERLEAAQDVGLLTEIAVELSTGILRERSVVVICLPVNMIADCVKEVASLSGQEVLITDAGSIKSSICNAVAEDAVADQKFVGAHPIAGGEHGGFENAEAELFQNRVCVVTDCARVDPQWQSRLDRAQRFWKAIGCRIQTMTPEQHDAVLALTSHLPHLMAAVTTSVVGEANLPLTGSGFRDTTRIAAGDPGLWKEILAGNRIQVVEAIGLAQEILSNYKAALMNGDDELIHQLLRAATTCRATLNCRQQ